MARIHPPCRGRSTTPMGTPDLRTSHEALGSLASRLLAQWGPRLHASVHAWTEELALLVDPVAVVEQAIVHLTLEGSTWDLLPRDAQLERCVRCALEEELQRAFPSIDHLVGPRRALLVGPTLRQGLRRFHALPLDQRRALRDHLLRGSLRLERAARRDDLRGAWEQVLGRQA